MLIDELSNFPRSICKENCSHPADCISSNSRHLRCITNTVISPVCYTIGVISLILKEEKVKTYETMLKTALKQLEKLSVWVNELQKNKGEVVLHLFEEERRICPRFNGQDIFAIIGSETYSLINISLTGCFIKTGISYPEGTIIDMCLNIGTEIPCRAVVKHSIEAGIGVDFTITDQRKEKEFLFFMSDFFLASAFIDPDKIQKEETYQ